MQAARYIEFTSPLPAHVQPIDLLGRLTRDPHLTPANLNEQLVPAPNRVSIQAILEGVPHVTATEIKGRKHAFAAGPAQIWNAMLANTRSVNAICDLFKNDKQAWLITEVFTVNNIVTALKCVNIHLVAGLFIVNAQDFSGVPFSTEPASWFARNPRTTMVLLIIGIAVGVAIAITIITSCILGAIGFGAGGVVAGSIAAGWQASIGSVAAGSLFAGLQSLGAVGLSAGVAAAFGAAVAAVFAAVTGTKAPPSTHVRIVDL